MPCGTEPGVNQPNPGSPGAWTPAAGGLCLQPDTHTAPAHTHGHASAHARLQTPAYSRKGL